MASARAKRLTKPEVEALIRELVGSEQVTQSALWAFAEKINGAPFKESAKTKNQALTLATVKSAVLAKFQCRTVAELRKNKTFIMSMTGEQVSLKTKDDWLRLYRRWVAVPESERNKTGPTCINGIDVLENFRPWHVFGLDPKQATSEDVKTAFRDLVKIHHPDAGGDPRVFERLQKMRDSVLALMN